MSAPEWADDNRFAAVGGVVLRGREVLLVRHTYGGAKGMLLIPSGMMKHGEMPYETFEREVFEEAGVRIAPEGMLGMRCRRDNWWLILLARHVSGEPRSDGAENSEALYLDAELALAREDVTPASKYMIEQALLHAPLAPHPAYENDDAASPRVLFTQRHKQQ